MQLRQSFFQAGLLAALLSGAALAWAAEEPAPAQAAMLAAAPVPEAQPMINPAKSESAPATAMAESGGLDGNLIALGLAAALLVFAFIPKGGKLVPSADPSPEPTAPPCDPAGEASETGQPVAEVAETEQAAAETEERSADEAAVEPEQASPTSAEVKSEPDADPSEG